MTIHAELLIIIYHLYLILLTTIIVLELLFIVTNLLIRIYHNLMATLHNSTPIITTKSANDDDSKHNQNTFCNYRYTELDKMLIINYSYQQSEYFGRTSFHDARSISLTCWWSKDNDAQVKTCRVPPPVATSWLVCVPHACWLHCLGEDRVCHPKY